MGLLLVLLFGLPVVLTICLYAVATRTRAVTNVAISLLRSQLKKHEFITDGDGASSLEPCTGGFVLRNVLVPKRLLKLPSGSVTIPVVFVRQLQLLWPTLSAPLTVRVSGVVVRVQQRRTAPRVQATGSSKRVNSGKLRALEALLWTGQQQGTSVLWHSRLLRFLRFAISLVLRNTAVVVADVDLQYQQCGDPAPSLPGPDGPAVDAIAVTVRAVNVSPVVDSACQEGEKLSSGGAAARRGKLQPTGLSPAMQSSLDRWFHLSRAAPRLVAFRDWLFRRMDVQPRVQYCNASRMTVTGVDIILLSKPPDATSVPGGDGRQPGPATPPSRRVGVRRRLVRPGLLPDRGAQTPPAGSAGVARAETGKASAAPEDPRWDVVAVILRQWSMQVDVSVGEDGVASSSTAATQPNGAQRRPLAVHVQGAFGVRSSRSKHAAKEAKPGCGPPEASVAGNGAAGLHGPAAADASTCRTSRGPGDAFGSSRGKSRPAAERRDNGVEQEHSGTHAAMNPTVVVHVSLKALLPELSPAASVQLLRMVDRVVAYEKYSKYWRLRPAVSVSQSPAAWWQHAGRAVKNECRAHGPLRNTDEAMARRAQYIRTYRTLHSMERGFLNTTWVPDYSSIDQQLPKSERPPLPKKPVAYPRPQKGSPRVQALRARLSQLESRLTLGEIVCWRIFVALQHSACLRANPAAAERWLNAMGVITTFYDAVPNFEEEDEDEDGGDGLAAGVAPAVGLAGKKRQAMQSAISVFVACPRLGLKLVNKNSLAAAAEPPPSAGSTAAAEGDKPKREADVFAVILEDIRFSMPTLHRMSLQAATIKASQFLGSTKGANLDVLVIPAPPESMETFGAKLEFSTPAPSGTANPGPTTSSAKASAAPGPLYADAPISSYIARFKVSFAAVELALMHPPLLLACARYVARMAELKALNSKASPSAAAPSAILQSSSLRSLVLDSYTRHRVSLPSLMASFKPKLQLYCPMVTARWLLQPDYTPAVGGLSAQQSQATVVAVLTEIRLSSRYVYTCYSSLLLSMSAQTHMEAYFQLLPRSPPTVGSEAASAPGTAPGLTEAEVQRPQRGAFAKMWLHPDDVSIAYPAEAKASQMPGIGGELRRASTLRTPGSLPTAASKGSASGPTSYPFVPLVKIRGLSALAMSQVPYEPAVPGSMTTHQTVGAHSIMAWVSPWQAKFIVNAVNQLLHHPALALMRRFRDKVSAAKHDARGPVSEQPAAPSRAGGQGASPQAGGGGSSVSVLVDVPLLVVNCYVEMPESVTGRADGQSLLNQACLRRPGTQLQVAHWAKRMAEGIKQAAEEQARRDAEEQARRAAAATTSAFQLPDDVRHMSSPSQQPQAQPRQPLDVSPAAAILLRWGLSITPLLTLNMTNVRAGLRLTEDNKFHATAQSSGLQVLDQQARLKRVVHDVVWLENAGRATRLPGRVDVDLPPESYDDQVLGPLPARAEAMRRFVCYRRRAALCLSLRMAPAAERRGQARQLWQRLFEVQQLYRASDFAMFLLSRTHQRTAHLARYESLQPIDCYRVLLQAFWRAEEEEKAGKPLHHSQSQLPRPAAAQEPAGGSTSSVAQEHTSTSPFQSGSVDFANNLLRDLNDAYRKRSSSDHARSHSTVFGPGVGPRLSAVGIPHRKTSSMLQALSTVGKGDTAGMTALMRRAKAAAEQDAGVAMLGSHGFESLSVTSATLLRNPEDGLQATPTANLPSVASRFINGPRNSNSSLGATASSALGDLGRSFRASYMRTSSIGIGAMFPSVFGAGASGILPLDSLGTEQSKTMQSAFVGASIESRAAVSSTVQAAPPVIDDVRPVVPEDPAVLEATARLCFVPAFQELFTYSAESQRWLVVRSVPVVTPFVQTLLSFVGGGADHGPTRNVRGSFQPLRGCLGVHSAGAMLQLTVQLLQVLHSGPPHQPRKADAPAVSAQAPSGGAHSSVARLNANMVLHCIDLKVVMEQVPHRERKPEQSRSSPEPPFGLTQLTSVQLEGIRLSATSPSDPVVIAIRDVRVLDLQGCVEHRNVLVAKRPFQTAQNESSPTGQPAQQGGNPGLARPCEVEILLESPSSPDLPFGVKIAVRHPCLTVLRRYVNNLSYAAGVMVKAYRDAQSRGTDGTSSARPPSEASSGPTHPSKPDAASGSDGSGPAARHVHIPPLITIQIEDLTVILPASAAAGHGPIRRCVHDEALLVQVSELSLCLPGSMAALSRVKFSEADCWVPSDVFITELMTDSLRLNHQLFPALSQPHCNEDTQPKGHTAGNTGTDLSLRQPPPMQFPRAPRPASGRLQKSLQVAKATLFDPIKEIIQEAGQKSNKARGELGLLLIEEGQTGPTGELSTGYLRVPEQDDRAVAASAAMHHTTTTFGVLPSSPAQPCQGPRLRDAGERQEEPRMAEPLAGVAGVSGVHVDSRPAATASAPAPGATCPGASPIVVFSAKGLSAYSCQLLSHDKRPGVPQSTGPPAASSGMPGSSGLAASKSAEPSTDPGRSSDLDQMPSGVTRRLSSPAGQDQQRDAALRLLADAEPQSVHRLIDPVVLEGVVFSHQHHGGVQLHLNAPEAMTAMLGPRRYERMIKVLTDNVVEAHSCFNVGFAAPRSASRDTAFSPNIAFGPRPGQLPYFLLTIAWSKHLLASLESDPSWWEKWRKPGQDVEPCLQGCFTQCRLGLIMMRPTNDMHLVFRSQEVHIADVRVSALLQKAASVPTQAASVYGDAPVSQTTDGYGHEDATMSGSCEGAVEEEYDEFDEQGPENDGASDDMPLGADVQPVIDDLQSEKFPGKPAVVTLLRSSIDLPAEESAHLASAAGAAVDGMPDGGACPHDGQHDCVRVAFSMLHDGTMGNEVELCHTLVQWPYLTEMSLVSSIISIFLPNWGHPVAGPEATLRMAAFPWFYFNLVLRESQIFIPVLSPHVRQYQEGVRGAVADAVPNDLQLTSEKLQELFASMVAADSWAGRVAQYDSVHGTAGLLGQISGQQDGTVDAVLRLRHLMADTSKAPQRLEHAGVALTMSALRVGYFGGGDGESEIKVDLRNIAGCARHSNAQVTNWLLPVQSMSIGYRCSMPTVEESRLLQGYILVARKISYMYRTRQWTRGAAAEIQQPPAALSRQQSKRTSNQQQPDLPTQQDDKLQQRVSAPGPAPMSEANKIGSGLTYVGEEVLSVHSRVTKAETEKPALDLLVEQAMARASELLEKHKLSLPTSATTRVTTEKLLNRRTAVFSLTFRSDTIIIRGSFSNIPLWLALRQDLGLMGNLLQRNRGLFAPAPAVLAAAPAQPVAAPSGSAEPSNGAANWNFRPSSMSVDVNVQSLAFVLCDDKPKSYGAPDVLTASTEQLALQYTTDKRYVDHLPEQSGSATFRLSAQFLNNSTGRWEHLLEPWPAELHLFDPINPIFKSSRTKYIFISSAELFKLSFHPSCLLTLGDCSAFLRGLTNAQESAAAGTARRHADVAVPRTETPPLIREQMALGGSIMSRVPQRYLIQNMTGMLLSYWAPQPDSDGRVQPAPSNKRWLASGCSEELQVVPTLKQVKIVGPGGVVITRLHSQVIVLKFEGNWLPIPDVSVDVVGKYCYKLHSPAEDMSAPVVVDVVLVGRTKILKIHSSLYVHNSTDLYMGFRLHLPSAALARQTALIRGDSYLPSDQDLRLRRLKPGEGRFLPVLAALGGTLYLEPRTAGKTSRPACSYMSPEHDVIRLSPTVTDMLGQSGFIACGPPVDPSKGMYGSSPLHFAVKVKVRSRQEYTYAAFHSIEVPGPGLFAKATRPLEASIKIMPTIRLNNALPYNMEGYLMTLNRSAKDQQLRSIRPSQAVQDRAAVGHGREQQPDGSSPQPVASAAGAAAATGSGALAAGAEGNMRSAPLGAVNGDAASEACKGPGPQPAAVQDSDRDRTMQAFNMLAQHLRHKPLYWRCNDDTEQKLSLLTLLRYELRCILRENIKEVDLLRRLEGREQAEKVTWQEIQAFLEWAKDNLRRVSRVFPGSRQCHYVDMHKQVLLCVKVPTLNLVTVRPIEVNYGESATSHEGEQLPEVMVLRTVAESETYDAIRTALVGARNVDQHKPALQTVIDAVKHVPQGINQGIQGINHGFQQGAAAAAAVFHSLPTVHIGGSDTSAEVSPGAFWRLHPKKLVRVQLVVKPGPWPGSGSATGIAAPADAAGLESSSVNPPASATPSQQLKSPAGTAEVQDGCVDVRVPPETRGPSGASSVSALSRASRALSRVLSPKHQLRFLFTRSQAAKQGPISPAGTDKRTVYVKDDELTRAPPTAAVLTTPVSQVSAEQPPAAAVANPQPSAAVAPQEPSAAVLVEEHIRLQISYPPPALPNAFDQIGQQMTRVAQIVRKRGGTRGAEGGKAAGRSRLATRSAGNPRTSFSASIRVQLQVVPGTPGTGERVKLNLLVIEDSFPVGGTITRPRKSSAPFSLALFKGSNDDKEEPLPLELTRVPGFTRKGGVHEAIPEDEDAELQSTGDLGSPVGLSGAVAEDGAHQQVDAPGRRTESSPAAYPASQPFNNSPAGSAAAGPSSSTAAPNALMHAQSAPVRSRRLSRLSGSPLGGGTSSPISPDDLGSVGELIAMSPTSPRTPGCSVKEPVEDSAAATPETVVVRSRPNSPISVPSASPSPRRPSVGTAAGIPTAVSPLATPSSCYVDKAKAGEVSLDGDASPTATGITCLSGTPGSVNASPVTAESCSPSPGIEPITRRPVWSDNAAYIRGSASTASVHELPVRGSLGDFVPGSNDRPVVREATEPTPLGSNSVDAFATRPSPYVRQRAGGLAGGSLSYRGVSVSSVKGLWRVQRHSLRAMSTRFVRVGSEVRNLFGADVSRSEGSRGLSGGVRRASQDDRIHVRRGSGEHAIYSTDGSNSRDAVFSGGSSSSAFGGQQAAGRAALRRSSCQAGQIPGRRVVSAVQRPSCDAGSPESRMRFYSIQGPALLERLRRVPQHTARLVTRRQPGLRGTDQPSYKRFGVVDDDSPTRAGGRPFAAAVQAVQSLPAKARNVGGKIVDGGQQVAVELATTIIASGQGVKTGTEHVYKTAKPKIKKGLGELAWQMTECMRKRKAGDDKLKSTDGARKKLNLFNSLATKEEDYVCELTLSAPFWLDNRTGFDLAFKEQDVYRYADNLPFLPFNSIRAPGNASDAKSLDAPVETAGGTLLEPRRSPTPAALRSMTAASGGTMRGQPKGKAGPPPPVLLNDQRRARFRVEDVRYSPTEFSFAFTVENTNQKFALDVMAEKVKIPADAYDSLMSRGLSDGVAMRQSEVNPIVATWRAATFGIHAKSLTAGHTDGQKQQLPLPPLPPAAAQFPNVARVLRQSLLRLRQQRARAAADGTATEDGSGPSQAAAVDELQGPFGSVTVAGSTRGGSAGGALVAVARADTAVVKPEENRRSSSPGLASGSTRFVASGPAAPAEGPSVIRLPEITPVEEDYAPSQVPVLPTPTLLAGGLRNQERSRDGPLRAFSDELSQPLSTAVSRETTGALGSAAPTPTVAISLHPAAAPYIPLPVSTLAEVEDSDSLVASPTTVQCLPTSSSRRGGESPQKRKPVVVRRLYQFAVEVWQAPGDSVFNRTKVVTVKNKYLILNATGLAIEYKQKGTPDPTASGLLGFGGGNRFSGSLPNGWRAAWHWDNAYAEQEIMIRPAGDDWDWSGSFKLPEVEDYFGLRIRRRHHRDSVIIPVSITVGAAGSVLVTLKSKGSVPPYMIMNRCQDVTIRLKQSEWTGRGATRRILSPDCNDWEDWDEVVPHANASTPFAWDEPRLKHVVKVVARSQQSDFPDSPDAANSIEIDLDAVNENTIMYVQSRAGAARLTGKAGPHERNKLLSDNAKKVYVTVYADGPTRVLSFSEDRTGVAYMDDENSLLNLSYRLQQVSVRLKDVDRQLALQFGTLPERQPGVQGPRTSHAPIGADAVTPTGPVDNESSLPEPSSRYASTIMQTAGAFGPSGLMRGGSLAQRRPAFNRAQPISGTATPPAMSLTRATTGGALDSFAFPRPLSVAHQEAIAAAGLPTRPTSYGRMPSLPGTTGVGQKLFPRHSRHPSEQRDFGGAGANVVTNTTGAAPEGPRPLFTATVAGDDNAAPLLEAPPVYANDIDMSIGGDLAVMFRYVEGLSAAFSSTEKLVGVEAKMKVNATDPALPHSTTAATLTWNQFADGAAGSIGGAAAAGGGADGAQAGVLSLGGTVQVFRDISAAAELQIDFYVAKGTESPHIGRSANTQGASVVTSPQPPSVNMNQRAAPAPRESYAQAQSGRNAQWHTTAQFAGCVRVPLMLTLGREKTQEWRLPLERETGSQLIRGHVVMSFEWSVTNEGMLIREVTALERILAEKVELLAMLNPLPVSATARFIRRVGAAGPTESTSAAADPAARTSGNRATAGPARLAAPKTAKSMAESYSINLELSVLEIAGLVPREGLRATLAASLYGRQPASVMSTAMLPQAVVVMTCGDETHKAEACVNSVNPRFPKNTCIFKNVPLGGTIKLQIVDQVSSAYTKTLAEGEVMVADIKGTDPIYAWLALPRHKRSSKSQRMLALLMVMEEDGDADVQVLVRIKVHKPQVHGVLAAVSLDLAGIGLCTKTNLEELFNFTMQKIQASLVQTRTLVQASFKVQTIQLDNQMLEANNPVVLSAADGSQSGSIGHARRRHTARLTRRDRDSPPILRLGNPGSALQDPLLSIEVTYNQASSNQAMLNATGPQDNMGILAFKKVAVDLGPLDFSADQEFIEAVIAYIHAMPLADFFQDKAWQDNIDKMQGGATASIGGYDDSIIQASKRRELQGAEAYKWLQEKEQAELELLRGQSSMWFYLEDFCLSDIFISVTLALNSSFNAGAGGAARRSLAAEGEDDRQRSMLRGFLSRVSGSNGFQLINVTNAPIQLNALVLRNHLVNRVSLVNKVYRHYYWEALVQARKVLGGAGPAIAQIPASVLWASIALVDLAQDVAAKRVHPLLVPTRIGYVMFTLTGQVIGVFSRTMLAVMAVLPPRFSTDNYHLTDTDAAERFGVKPLTVMDAMFMAQRDVVLGIMSAAFGVVHDTAAGGRWKGGLVALGIPVGLAKATLGLAVRPAAGTVEATSKLLQGIGLLCLGKRGIQGKLVRRVQAPGVAITDVVQAARASVALEALQASLVAAWQAALPSISSTLADDEVVDVVAARPTRVVLLTNRHLAYIYARRHASAASGAFFSASNNTGAGGAASALSVTYRVKWIIRNDHIDNIRGLERGYCVSVDYHKPVMLGRLSLKLPLHRGMRTTTAEGHKDLIFRLNRHLGHSINGTSARRFVSLAASREASSVSVEDDVQDLRITSYSARLSLPAPAAAAATAGGSAAGAAAAVPQTAGAPMAPLPSGQASP